jgi:hypothetical protein
MGKPVGSKGRWLAGEETMKLVPVVVEVVPAWVSSLGIDLRGWRNSCEVLCGWVGML